MTKRVLISLSFFCISTFASTVTFAQDDALTPAEREQLEKECAEVESPQAFKLLGCEKLISTPEPEVPELEGPEDPSAITNKTRPEKSAKPVTLDELARRYDLAQQRAINTRNYDVELRRKGVKYAVIMTLINTAVYTAVPFIGTRGDESRYDDTRYLTSGITSGAVTSGLVGAAIATDQPKGVIALGATAYGVVLLRGILDTVFTLR